MQSPPAVAASASASSASSMSSTLIAAASTATSTQPRAKTGFTPRPPTLPKQPSIGNSSNNSASNSGSGSTQNGSAATNGSSTASANSSTSSPTGSSNSLPLLRAAPSSASSPALLPPSSSSSASSANLISPPSKLSMSAASNGNGNGNGVAVAPNSGGSTSTTSSATSSPAIPLRKKQSSRVPPSAIDLPSDIASTAAAASSGANSPRPAQAASHTPIMINAAATLTPLPASAYSTPPAATAAAPSPNGQLQPLTTNPSPLGSAYDEVRIPISFQLPPTATAATAATAEPPMLVAAAASHSSTMLLHHPQPARESAFVSVPISASLAAAAAPLPVASPVFAANGLPSAHQSVPLPASFHAPSTPVRYASPSPSHAAAAATAAANLPHLLIPGSPALPAFPLAAAAALGTPSSPAGPSGFGNGGGNGNGMTQSVLPYPVVSALAADAVPVTGVSMNSKQWAQLLYRYRAVETPTPGSAGGPRTGLGTPASPSLLHSHSESLSTPPLHSPNALGARPSSRTRSRQMQRKVSEVDQVASANAAASATAAVAAAAATATPSLVPLAPQPQQQHQQPQHPVMDAEKFAMQNELNRLRAVIAMQTHAAASASQQLQQQQLQQQQQQQTTPQHFPSPHALLPNHQAQHLAHLYAPSPTPSPSSGPGLSWNTAFAAMSNSMSMQNLAAASAAAAAAAAVAASAASPSPQPFGLGSELQQQHPPVFSSLPSPMIAPLTDVNASQQDHRSTYRSMSMLIRSGSAQPQQQHHHASPSSHLHAPLHFASAVPHAMGSLVRSRSAEDSAHFPSGSSPGPSSHLYPQQHSALSVMVGSSAASAAAQAQTPTRPPATIVAEELDEPLSARAVLDDDEDHNAPADAEIDAEAESGELDAMTEVADFLARNDAPVPPPPLPEPLATVSQPQDATPLQALNDQPTAVKVAAPAKDAVLSATSSPTSPSAAANLKSVAAASANLAAPAPAATAASSSNRVAVPGQRKSPRGGSGGACTNPSCADRLATQRAELWKLLSSKSSEEKDALARVSRAAEQRLARELAAKDARIAALEKTQKKLLASAGGGAKVLQAQVDELQAIVARLRAQVESLGAVPVGAAAVAAATTSADASTATSSDEPDATSVPEGFAGASSSGAGSSLNGRRAAMTVDVGSDSSSTAQPASPLPQLQQAPDQPFFNTSAPRTVHSKVSKGNTRRRSASFGSSARLHSVAAAAAASAHAAASSGAATASPASISKPVSTDSSHSTARSDAKAPSRPMASNPQSGQPIRARANSLRTTAEAPPAASVGAGASALGASSGIHASLQAASPSRSGSVRKNSRGRPNNTPGTPTAVAVASGGGLSVSGTAVDSGTPKQRPSFSSLNVRPQPQSQQNQLPPSGASVAVSANHASAADSLPSSLSPTASQLASSREHSPGSLSLPTAVAGED